MFYINDPIEFSEDCAKILVYAGAALFFLILIWVTMKPYFEGPPPAGPAFPIGFQPPSM